MVVFTDYILFSKHSPFPAEGNNSYLSHFSQRRRKNFSTVRYKLTGLNFYIQNAKNFFLFKNMAFNAWKQSSGTGKLANWLVLCVSYIKKMLCKFIKFLIKLLCTTFWEGRWGQKSSLICCSWSPNRTNSKLSAVLLQSKLLPTILNQRTVLCFIPRSGHEASKVSKRVFTDVLCHYWKDSFYLKKQGRLSLGSFKRHFGTLQQRNLLLYDFNLSDLRFIRLKCQK